MLRGGRSSCDCVVRASQSGTTPQETQRSWPYQPHTSVTRGSRLLTSQHQHNILPMGTDPASADTSVSDSHGTSTPNLFIPGCQVADLSVEDFVFVVRAVVQLENTAASRATSLPLSIVWDYTTIRPQHQTTIIRHVWDYTTIRPQPSYSDQSFVHSSRRCFGSAHISHGDHINDGLVTQTVSSTVTSSWIVGRSNSYLRYGSYITLTCGVHFCAFLCV